ncbi:hypothetical protein K438DRAFT_1759133 [Mycena galopus ATCC 62051]|nr:hypothetical protein K438DRAFT_1759133 [Mycena galopus ATCC 62051]
MLLRAEGTEETKKGNAGVTFSDLRKLLSVENAVGPPPVTVTATAVVSTAVFLDFKHLTGRDGQRDGRGGRKNGISLIERYLLITAPIDPLNRANIVRLNLGHSAIICGLCRKSQ